MRRHPERAARVLMLIPLVALAACQRERDANEEVAVEAWQAEQDSDSVVVRDEYLIALPERENFLERVRDDFRQHEKLETSERLGYVAARLREEEARVPEARPLLSASRSEIDELAMQLARGADVDRHQIRRALARAHLALEGAHQMAAETKRVAAYEHRQNEDVREELAEALDGAAGHLERAARAADDAADTEIRSAVSEAHALAERLRQGRTAVTSDVEHALTRLGTEARRLGNEIGAR